MPRSGGLPETAFQILDGDIRTCHWPPLLRVLYERFRTGAAPPPVHLPVPDLLVRIGTDPRGGAGLRQRFVHYSHTAHPTQRMSPGVFTKPLGLALM
jgi:hypothetical protein